MTPVRLVAGLVALNAALILAGVALVPARAAASGHGLHVGLVFDVGGKNDKSFNEAAWRGLERARSELGVQVVFIEPSEGADRETALRSLAARGNDLVIAVGYIFASDLERIAPQFPAVKFAGIDYTPSAGVVMPPNLEGISFREQEGSFLVGAIAARLTHTKTVGFVGGMKIPLIRKFEAGYVAGVAHECPDCRVVSAYAGSDPSAFADPSLGAELAAAQYDQGADIIFHAAGKTGDGVFAAARQRGARAIGVDSDQHDVAPCCVITSMVKGVDVAVLGVVADVAAGRFRGGMRELGLAEDGVGFVANDDNRDLLPLDVVQRARGLRDAIIAGQIRVPAQ